MLVEQIADNLARWYSDLRYEYREAVTGDLGWFVVNFYGKEFDRLSLPVILCSVITNPGEGKWALDDSGKTVEEQLEILKDYRAVMVVYGYARSGVAVAPESSGNTNAHEYRRVGYVDSLIEDETNNRFFKEIPTCWNDTNAKRVSKNSTGLV